MGWWPCALAARAADSAVQAARKMGRVLCLLMSTKWDVERGVVWCGNAWWAGGVWDVRVWHGWVWHGCVCVWHGWVWHGWVACVGGEKMPAAHSWHTATAVGNKQCFLHFCVAWVCSEQISAAYFDGLTPPRGK